MTGPRRVDQAPVVAGQLGIPPIDLRVIQVRLLHPDLEVIRVSLHGAPAEELERGHVRLGPRTLSPTHHRADEQVARVRQHNRGLSSTSARCLSRVILKGDGQIRNATNGVLHVKVRKPGDMPKVIRYTLHKCGKKLRFNRIPVTLAYPSDSTVDAKGNGAESCRADDGDSGQHGRMML
jgi:hypothetical protein